MTNAVIGREKAYTKEIICSDPFCAYCLPFSMDLDIVPGLLIMDIEIQQMYPPGQEPPGFSDMIRCPGCGAPTVLRIRAVAING